MRYHLNPKRQGDSGALKWRAGVGPEWSKSGFPGREMVKGGRPPMGQCCLFYPFTLFAPLFTPLLVSSLNQIHSTSLSSNPPNAGWETLSLVHMCVCVCKCVPLNMSQWTRVWDSISDVQHKLKLSLKLKAHTRKCHLYSLVVDTCWSTVCTSYTSAGVCRRLEWYWCH